jgi:hypothetical protein
MLVVAAVSQCCGHRAVGSRVTCPWRRTAAAVRAAGDSRPTTNLASSPRAASPTSCFQETCAPGAPPLVACVDPRSSSPPCSYSQSKAPLFTQQKTQISINPDSQMLTPPKISLVKIQPTLANVCANTFKSRHFSQLELAGRVGDHFGHLAVGDLCVVW